MYICRPLLLQACDNIICNHFELFALLQYPDRVILSTSLYFFFFNNSTFSILEQRLRLILMVGVHSSSSDPNMA